MKLQQRGEGGKLLSLHSSVGDAVLTEMEEGNDFTLLLIAKLLLHVSPLTPGINFPKVRNGCLGEG